MQCECMVDLRFFFVQSTKLLLRFKVKNLSEKILLQLFPKCSDSDELSINNGNGTYLLTCNSLHTFEMAICTNTITRFLFFR